MLRTVAHTQEKSKGPHNFRFLAKLIPATLHCKRNRYKIKKILQNLQAMIKQLAAVFSVQFIMSLQRFHKFVQLILQ